MIVTEYEVSGMSCAHCESAIRDEVGRIEGVQAIEVSAETGRLTVTSRDELPADQVIAAVDEAGYAAVPAR